MNNFQNEASRAQLDLTGDSKETMNLNSTLKRWDRKKKKMVTIEVNTIHFFIYIFRYFRENVSKLHELENLFVC